MPAIIPQWVPNTPAITLPNNLQYVDSNGNTVYSLYPREYLILIGQNVNTIISNYVALTSQVATNTGNINELFIITSGITTPYHTPTISPQCVGNGCSGCTAQPIDTVLIELLNSYCSLYSILGGTGSLANAITKECANLNSATSFANPKASMSAINGWVSNPATIADTIVDIWLTLCDARAGITNALAAVTPTCSQVIINFAATVVSYSTGINVFFDGYTFIPTGFIDNGSIIKVTDSAGNVYQTAIDVVARSTNTSAFNIPLTGTTLIPTSNYTITLISSVINNTLGLTCNKTTLQTITNNIAYCPVLNAVASGQTAIGFTLIPYITSNVTYRVDLYYATGGTSQANVSFVNPSSAQTYTFSGLASATAYNLVVTTTVVGIAPYVCPPVSATS